MPEGPTIKALKEKLEPFIGQKVVKAVGYAKGFDPLMLNGAPINDIKTWGKQLLICFPDFTLRLHMGLFGSYRINDRGKRNASVGMQFKEGEVNFYITQAKVITEPLDEVYDWQADLMNPHFSVAKARKKLKEKPKLLICDALLNQDIFAGSGNIVKNEVLFRVRVHPESTVGDIPSPKLTQLINEAVVFCKDFYRWRQAGVLTKNLEAYEKNECPRNHIPLHKADLGKTKRHCYYCPRCQIKYPKTKQHVAA